MLKREISVPTEMLASTLHTAGRCGLTSSLSFSVVALSFMMMTFSKVITASK